MSLSIKPSGPPIRSSSYDTRAGGRSSGPRNLAKEGEGSLPLEEVYTNPRMPVVHLDQPLDLALSKIGDWPLLPVVSRADFGKLEGAISIDDTLRAYKDYDNSSA